MTIKPNIVPDDRPTNDPSLADATIVSAVRHVGPTLESDPEYDGHPMTESSSPEEQMAAQRNVLGVDLLALSAEDAGLLGSTEPEPLKTRLPGDTSSDPHTDLGPDNATTVSSRGERNRH